MTRVYLSGCMDGVSEEQGNGWRKKASLYLKEHDFDIYNPYDIALGEDKNNRTSKEIHDNDIYWLDKSDIILVNLMLPDIIKSSDIPFFSIGELYLGHRARKPIISFTNCLSHRAGYQAIVTKSLPNLEECLEYIVLHYT